MIELIIGAILGLGAAIIGAILTTPNMKEWLNFRIGRLISRECRNGIHDYEFKTMMRLDNLNKTHFVYQCKICGDRTTGDSSHIYIKKLDKLVPID